jgi:hypothetical protein
VQLVVLREHGVGAGGHIVEPALEVFHNLAQLLDVETNLVDVSAFGGLFKVFTCESLELILYLFFFEVAHDSVNLHSYKWIDSSNIGYNDNISQ